MKSSLQTGTVLDIRNLSVRYGGTRETKSYAVKDFSLKVASGDIVGLLGESGAGKSTVGWAVLGMIAKPNLVTGEINVDGSNVLKMNERELRDYRWRKASMIFQASMNTLDPVVTIRTSFADLLKSKGIVSHKSNASTIIKDSLEQVELDPSVMRMYPHQLSGGMKQRLAIAMSIVTGPQILIADEPTTALDTVTQSTVLRLIKKLKNGGKIRSIIFISHDINVHAYMTDRIAVMFRGRLVEEGATKDVITKPLHPYTKLLMSSMRIGGRKEIVLPAAAESGSDAITTTKTTASQTTTTTGLSYQETQGEEDYCPYVQFCPYAMAVCSNKFPETTTVKSESNGHEVACFLYGGA
jgi:ABC-type dipeptide/oligopeptide/nickel transport system ATPase component